MNPQQDLNNHAETSLSDILQLCRQSPIFFINIATFVILKHPVTTLVTDFTNPENLNNDLRILKYFAIHLIASTFKSSCKSRKNFRVQICQTNLNPQINLNSNLILIIQHTQTKSKKFVSDDILIQRTSSKPPIWMKFGLESS